MSSLNGIELREQIMDHVESGYTAGAQALAIVYLADTIGSLGVEEVKDGIQTVAEEVTLLTDKVGSVAEVIGRR